MSQRVSFQQNVPHEAQNLVYVSSKQIARILSLSVWLPLAHVT